MWTGWIIYWPIYVGFYPAHSIANFIQWFFTYTHDFQLFFYTTCLDIWFVCFDILKLFMP